MIFKPMTIPSRSRARYSARAITRLIGALALLATGAIHLEQYIVADYRAIPTIAPLFLLNFIAGTALGLYFLVPARASVGPVRRSIDTFAAFAGWAVAAGGLVALLVSEHTPLFGFMEQGYRVEIVIAIVAEGVTVVALGALLALSHTRPDRKHGTGRGSDGAIPVTPASTATESS
jgi:hypothetical protein